MQLVLERGLINKILNFDVALIQLSFHIVFNFLIFYINVHLYILIFKYFYWYETLFFTRIQGKSAKQIRNFGKRIGSKGWSVGLRRETCGREVGWRSVAAPSPPVRAGVGGVCRQSRTAERRCVNRCS